MKVNIKDIGGDIVKNDETYLLKDNKFLKNLVLSSTDLKPNMSTRGHKHQGQEEVYLFIKGSGTMEIDNNKFFVDEGDFLERAWFGKKAYMCCTGQDVFMRTQSESR